MKNLVRLYSEENQGVEPWVYSERKLAASEAEIQLELTYCEYLDEVKLESLLQEFLFVAEDANYPGDFHAGDDLAEVQSYCSKANEDGGAFFIYPQSRGFAC